MPRRVPVIYMVPECGERSFRARLDIMGIPDEDFYVRTMKDGAPLQLNDNRLLDAAKDLQPLVVLDSAIRFNPATTENDAAANKKFTDGVFGVMRAGWRGMLGLHHSSKASSGQDMTLENVLRGTGDLAAICDAVYGLQTLDAESFRVQVENLKARDYELIRPFQVEGRPYLNTTGDFHLRDWSLSKGEREVEVFEKFIAKNPKASYRTITQQTGIAQGRVKEVADKCGAFQTDEGIWAFPGDPQKLLVSF